MLTSPPSLNTSNWLFKDNWFPFFGFRNSNRRLSGWAMHGMIWYAAYGAFHMDEPIAHRSTDHADEGL
jgi:hypothetical protein